MNAFFKITISLARNTVSNRYGTLVPGNNSMTFLYDECYLSTVFTSNLSLHFIDIRQHVSFSTSTFELLEVIDIVYCD